MKIAILGYGEQGRSAYEYWKSPENSITICDIDHNVQLPSDVQKQLGENYLANLGEFDLIVRSPSVHPNDIVKANSPDILQKVTTVTNEFFRVCPTKNIIGVTGTKGKGTTSTLIAKMLEAAGKRVHLGGNIGTPPLDLLNPPAGGRIQADDWVVLELANFQLIDIKYSPHIAVCLMMVPEHQDWHASVEDYFSAKQQLFAHQTNQDFAIYFAENDVSQKIASVGSGQKVPFMRPPGAEVVDHQVMINGKLICKTDEIKLLGRHNWQNICAAVTAVWQITQDVSAIKSVITSFKGLPNRLEPVRELNGVWYYNDSFASAPDATIAAIEAIEKPKVTIIGGRDRKLNLTELAESLHKNEDSIRSVVLIGEAAVRIAQVLERHGFRNFELSRAKDITTIIKLAQSKAAPGDVVILSPGFPSFDMFKNFEDRGNQYRNAVNAL